MTPRRRRFVDEYLIDLNATQAAIRAGYSEQTAYAIGHELLKKPEIASEIDRRRSELALSTNITNERVLKELAVIAFSDVGEVLDFSGDSPRLKAPADITESARRSIASVKVKRYMEGHGEDAKEVEVTEFRFWSKDAALDKIGKHLGMFPERVIVDDPARLTEDELKAKADQVRKKVRLMA